MNILYKDFISVESLLPPERVEVIFWTGEREFNGFIDDDNEIWEFVSETEMEYHSNISDGYITHWKSTNN